MLFLWGIAAWLMFYSLRYPASAAQAAHRALLLCAQSVIPSLFVFAVGAKILVGADFAGMILKLPLGGVCRLFGVSGAGLAAILIGLFSGFPVGASVLADFVRRGEMERSEAEDLMPFCNGAGASFVIGTVGGAFFGSAKIGAVFLFAQTAATVAALLLTAKKRRRIFPKNARLGIKKASVPSILASAVGEGACAMLSVSGFVTFFSVFSSSVSSVFQEANGIFVAIFGSFLEISSGLALLSRQTALPLVIRTALAGFFLGFGGLSVMMQAADRAEAAQISMKKYVSGKLLAGTLCGTFCALFG